MKRLARHAVVAVAALGAMAWAGPDAARKAGKPVFRLRGQDRAAVIVAEKMGIGRVLAKYLKLMTGVDVPVSQTPGPAGALNIYVGPSEALKARGLPPEGLNPFGYVFELLDQDTLAICSARPALSEHAVLMFLHRYAGYRWFAPGEIGEVIPKSDVISLPDTISVREEPRGFTSYVNAGMYHAYGAYLIGWRETLASGHNFTKILPPEKYGHEPDRYCMIDGKRFVPGPKLGGTWQPCVSHPDLPRLTVEWAKEYFKKNPHMLGFSACVNDGGGDCHCPACDEKQAKYGNRYLPYYNETARLLAKEMPGKFVDIYAYGGAAGVPRNIGVEPNLFVMVCQPYAENDKLIQGWADAGAKSLGIYQYLYGGRYLVPRHYPRLLGNKWKESYKKHGLIGAWTETFTVCWLYDGPRQYVLNSLAWNMDADIEALLNDYFTRFYAEAAAPMRRFFDRIEEIHGRKKDPFHFISDGNRPQQLDEYEAADLAFLDGCVAEAGRLAKDEMVRKRVQVFAKIWGLSRLDVLARVNTKALRALDATKPGAAEQARSLAAEACAALEDKARYTLTEWEEKNALIPKQPLAEYKLTVQQEPDLETAIDGAFERVWQAMTAQGKAAQAKALFEDLSRQGGEGRLGALARTRLFLAGDKPVNKVKNSSFEDGRKGEPAKDEADTLKRYEWTAFKPADWSTWHFQQSVTRFSWDETVAHSGKRSVAVGRNQIAGSFQQYVPVTPGERYRLSVWVKQKPSKGASVSVRWVNKKGWRDEGPNRVPTVRVALEPGEENWRQVTASFTVPEDVLSAVILLSAPRQEEGEMTWFDDVTMERILPAPKNP